MSGVSSPVLPGRPNVIPGGLVEHSAYRRLPTGSVTLLLADIEGSTRLWERQPEQMAAALSAMDRKLAELVVLHDGVCPVEQGEGDSFVVAFRRPDDAVACALALQHASFAPVRLRIGVHTGDVRLRDEGKYMGPTVNRAARVRDLGHGGQTLLSAATVDLVREQLPEQAWLVDLGQYLLRDLASAERVAQLCHAGLRNDFSPLRIRPNRAARFRAVRMARLARHVAALVC
jgi:class 3 adenylate cyclase